MENNIEKLIKQQEEEFKEMGIFICSCKVYNDGECPRFERVLGWHKSSIKQILEALVEREDKEIQKIKISENTELQEVWNSTKQDTISYLKQQIKLLE